MNEKPTSSITDKPHVTEQVIDDSIMRSYHWETPEHQHIFLYLTIALKESSEHGSYLLVQPNLDSSDVKGQGDFLWQFLKNELQTLASSGLNGAPPLPVIHEYKPNQFSVRLAETDPSYVRKGSSYFAIYYP